MSFSIKLKFKLARAAKILSESTPDVKILIEMNRQSDKEGFDRDVAVDAGIPNEAILPGPGALLERLTKDLAANRKLEWLQGYDEVIQKRAQEFKFRLKKQAAEQKK